MRKIGWLVAIGVLSCRPAATPRWEIRGPAELFERGLVSAESADVKVTFSPDGQRMLWGAIGRAGGKGGWEIFESRREGGRWGAARPAGFNSEANDFDPFFAPDGGGVYFFSNRPGGLGGDDLWFAPFSAAQGAYEEPRNLGPSVNTAGDEWAPVLSPDGTRLLFATDGRGGQGKHDLFLARKNAHGAWDAPENLGPAVNSADDDFDATFLDGARGIVFSSGDLDGAEVRLLMARQDGATYAGRAALGPEINRPGTWSFGPAVSSADPGFLYFTSGRAGGAGRMDIYRVRFVFE